VQNTRGIFGGVDQQITPRWLAAGVTRITGIAGGASKVKGQRSNYSFGHFWSKVIKQ
jgi:hypothetical protein